jgi:hypothetical protein
MGTERPSDEALDSETFFMVKYEYVQDTHRQVWTLESVTNSRFMTSRHASRYVWNR